MKTLLIILLFPFLGHCQPATVQYVNKAIDSFAHTLDSTVIKLPKQTTTNNSIILDTLTIPNNTSAAFGIIILTDSDQMSRQVYIKNVAGIYSIIDDRDVLSFAHGKTVSFFSTKIYYSVSAAIINGIVVIVATGKKDTGMTWRLSRQIL